MRINRKAFFRLGIAGAAGAAVSERLSGTGGSSMSAAEAKPKKQEGAAIKGVTDAVARFILNTNLKSMPPDAVAQGKRCLIDGFGVILAGSTVQGSAIVRDYVKRVSDKQEALVIGAGSFMAPVPHAALVNGASGHAMDYDDTQLSTTPDRTFGLLTHPTIPALASALAVAERANVSGAAFLEAFLDWLRSGVQDRRSDRSRSLQQGIPFDGHDRHLCLRRGHGKADEHEGAADQAHARHRREHVERHPRELRNDDQAAARGARGGERHRRGRARRRRFYRGRRRA